jgi:hypothetical protein
MDLEGSSRGAVKYLYCNFPGMIQETTGKIRDDTPCLGRDSNPAPTEQNMGTIESINICRAVHDARTVKQETNTIFFICDEQSLQFDPIQNSFDSFW